MTANGREPGKSDRHEAERVRESEAPGSRLVDTMFRDAARREPRPSQSHRPGGVHHTELPEAGTGQPLATEWNTYRREVGRLLAEPPRVSRLAGWAGIALVAIIVAALIPSAVSRARSEHRRPVDAEERGDQSGPRVVARRRPHASR